jgi:hypothetical protein
MYKSKGYRKNRADYQVCANDGTMYPSWPYLYPGAGIQQQFPGGSPWRQQPGAGYGSPYPGGGYPGGMGGYPGGMGGYPGGMGGYPGGMGGYPGGMGGYPGGMGGYPGGGYPGQQRLVSQDSFDQVTFPPDYDDMSS